MAADCLPREALNSAHPHCRGIKRRTDLVGRLHDAVVHRPWRGGTHHHRDTAAAVGGTAGGRGRCRSHLQEDGSGRALKGCLCRKMYSCLCHTYSLTRLSKLGFLYLFLGLPVHAHQSDTAAASVSEAGGPFSDVLSLPISSLFRDPYVPIRQL